MLNYLAIYSKLRKTKDKPNLVDNDEPTKSQKINLCQRLAERQCWIFGNFPTVEHPSLKMTMTIEKQHCEKLLFKANCS